MRSKQVSVVREIHTLRSTWRGLETWHGRNAVTPRNRKGEATGNTNFDLNRRASLRPYQKPHAPYEPRRSGKLECLISFVRVPADGGKWRERSQDTTCQNRMSVR